MLFESLSKLDVNLDLTIRYDNFGCWTHRWLVIRAFAIRVFANPLFYFSIMSIDIQSADTVEAAAQAHWVARPFHWEFHWLAPPFWLRGLQINASHGASLRKSAAMLNVCNFTLFRYKRRFAGTQPPHISHLHSQVRPVNPLLEQHCRLARLAPILWSIIIARSTHDERKTSRVELFTVQQVFLFRDSCNISNFEFLSY
jgi:hypothetical protein